MILYQTENFGKRYEFRSNVHRNWCVAPHIHEFSEIAYSYSGTATVYLDGVRHRVPERHLIFIFPNQIHEYSGETESFFRCAVFSNDFVPLFFEKTGGMRLKDPVVGGEGLAKILQMLEQTEPTDSLALCGILNLLCGNVLQNSELVPTRTLPSPAVRDSIVYISEHFQQDVSLKMLAEKLGYHEKYLSTLLHTLTGMNFRRVLASYRVNFARQLLRGGERTIAEIAFASGFSSVNSFNRAFRELTGMTPSEYRKRK